MDDIIERISTLEFQDIELGLEVVLKSGGPAMVIEKIVGEDAFCVWFDKNHKLHERAFAWRLLKRDLRFDRMIDDINRKGSKIPIGSA